MLRAENITANEPIPLGESRIGIYSIWTYYQVIVIHLKWAVTKRLWILMKDISSHGDFDTFGIVQYSCHPDASCFSWITKY